MGAAGRPTLAWVSWWFRSEYAFFCAPPPSCFSPDSTAEPGYGHLLQHLFPMPDLSFWDGRCGVRVLVLKRAEGRGHQSVTGVM